MQQKRDNVQLQKAVAEMAHGKSKRKTGKRPNKAMRSTRSHNQQPRSAKTISDQCNETLKEGLNPLCGRENALWKMPRVRNQKQASNRQKRWAIANKHTTLNESKVT